MAYIYGAQKKTRTSTRLTGLAPETSASTNSAIWATAVILPETPKKVKRILIYFLMRFAPIMTHPNFCNQWDR